MATENAETGKAEDGKGGNGGNSARGKVRWMAALAVLVLLAFGVLAWLESRRDHVSTDDAQVDGHIIPVASRVYGTVSEVLVDDNQAVHAGDVILRIDARDYQVKVDQAEAALRLAESQAKAAGMGVSLTRETTSSVRNSPTI
jgi:membrane fusion protein (multidrug efflux system)